MQSKKGCKIRKLCPVLKITYENPDIYKVSRLYFTWKRKWKKERREESERGPVNRSQLGLSVQFMDDSVDSKRDMAQKNCLTGSGMGKWTIRSDDPMSIEPHLNQGLPHPSFSLNRRSTIYVNHSIPECI